MSSIILACVYERTKINVIRFSVQKNVLEKVRNPRQSVVGFSVVFCAVCVRFARRPGVGLGEGGEPGPEAVGDREDHRADVAGADGRGEAGVHGRIRGGEGGTVPRSEDCLSVTPTRRADGSPAKTNNNNNHNHNTNSLFQTQGPWLVT